MGYLLHYPSRIKVDNIIISININDLIKYPLLAVLPSSEKADYPVYLQVHPRSSGVFWEVMASEGFRQTTLQTPMGEVLSLYKRLTDDLDLHVRLMQDGKILQEIEPHRYSLSHLSSFLFPAVFPCFYEVKSILDRHRIPYRILYNGRECEVVEVKSFLIE